MQKAFINSIVYCKKLLVPYFGLSNVHYDDLEMFETTVVKIYFKYSKNLGTNVSIKLNYLHSHLDFLTI